MHVAAELAAWVDQTLAGPLGDEARAASPGRPPDIAITALPAAASTRVFFRVSMGAFRFIAMFSPPATEDNPRYIRLTELFRGHGLMTPAVYRADLHRGYLLVEDLGERDFATAYAAGEIEAPLEAAIEALVVLQSVAGDIPPYTTARFADELAIFTDFLVRRFLHLKVPSFFATTVAALIEATRSVPQCTVHRDYHCRNLIWRGDAGVANGAGARLGAVGIVDFQDALVGPGCYDLASLLRDCYYEFDEAAIARWRRRYFDLAGWRCEPAVFDRAFDLIAIQRQLKAVGIFTRLYLNRRRADHLGDVPPVLERIARLGRHYPETAELANWLAAEVLPRAARRVAALS